MKKVVLLSLTLLLTISCAVTPVQEPLIPPALPEYKPPVQFLLAPPDFTGDFSSNPKFDPVELTEMENWETPERQVYILTEDLDGKPSERPLYRLTRVRNWEAFKHSIPEMKKVLYLHFINYNEGTKKFYAAYSSILRSYVESQERSRFQESLNTLNNKLNSLQNVYFLNYFNSLNRSQFLDSTPVTCYSRPFGLGLSITCR